MDSKSDMTDALELLKWQLELGVDENIGNIPLNRFSDPSQQNEVEIEIPVSTQQKMPTAQLHIKLPNAEAIDGLLPHLNFE